MKNVLKKLVKRASAMVLAVLCVTALCTGALAEEGTPALKAVSEDKANIVVTGAGNDTIGAYRLIDITWDKDANTVERTWNNDFAPYFANKDNGGELTVDEYSKLADEDKNTILYGLYGYIKDTYPKNHSGTNFPEPLGGWITSTNGTATITDAKPGIYFIVPKYTDSIYKPNLAVLEPKDDGNGNYVLNNTVLTIKKVR